MTWKEVFWKEVLSVNWYYPGRGMIWKEIFFGKRYNLERGSMWKEATTLCCLPLHLMGHLEERVPKTPNIITHILSGLSPERKPNTMRAKDEYVICNMSALLRIAY